MPEILSRRAEARRFVPSDLDPTDPEAVSRLFDTLEAREVASRDALEALILDWEELAGYVYERFTMLAVDAAGYTANEEYERAYIEMIEKILPVIEERSFKLKQKVFASPALDELGPLYEVFLRDLRAEVEIFREENIPLQVEERKLGQQYDKIAGAQQTEFRGETYTVVQLEQFFDSPDRQTREEAWRARAEVFLHDSDELNALFDKMYEVRQQIATNAGFDNYRDYAFKEKKRFDYTPEDCLQYHEAVARRITPLVAQDWEERRKKLGVETLRPWDVNVRPNDPIVDPDGRPALRPFDTPERLADGCERVFGQVDPELGGFFRQMRDEKLLDLENRPNKAPGAFMTAFSDTRVPFILMNAVGSKEDVDTLLHEAGHAFHYFLARRQPLISYHHTGHEFSEVASMSMELLARPYLQEFFSEDDLKVIFDEQIKKIVGFFPWNAMIDAFQHWLYTSEDHDAQARKRKWAELEERFRPWIDWSGLEDHRGIVWQYPHIFGYPFYYIEYGIAQLAALRIWLSSLEERSEAVQAYKRALSLGASRPLPELFTEAGAKFSLSEDTVGEIVQGAAERARD